MCGILAAFGLTGDAVANRRQLLKLSKLLRHRGPDANSMWNSADGRNFIGHERLTIIDVSDAGKQPFIIDRPDGRIAWALNSEIYNHEHLKATYLPGVTIPTTSDSAVPGYLWNKYGGISNELLNSFDGMYTCVLYDEATKEYMAFRDPIGVCPLYWGKTADGAVWFASELKALEGVCTEYDVFPPGHVYRSSTGTLEQWYRPDWMTPGRIPSTPVDLKQLRETFEAAVVKRLMSDVPLGVLLSGGLDSSLVASIAVRHKQSTANSYKGEEKLHTFSIGIKGSPDLQNARAVAAHLGTIHHEFHFTVQEGLDALTDLIWHIESYEQVRAAVPMYLLARKIKALGIKVVLSGEGADEIFGGYLYFHKAPSPEAFHEELVRKVTRLHQWDVLRANKACFAFGLEPRVPFLDKQFLQVSMNIDPRDKMCDRSSKPDGLHAKGEKYILRKAFDTPERPYLPESVLWRQKEQFSDGVGYDWVDGLKEYAGRVVTEDMWAARASRFPVDTPRTKEYYLLRSIFEEHYPSASALHTVPKGLSIACSTPEAVSWDPAWANIHEISGRAILDVHEQAEGFVSMDGDINEESTSSSAANGASRNGTGKIPVAAALPVRSAPLQRSAPSVTPMFGARSLSRPLLRAPALAARRAAAPRAACGSAAVRLI